jgi:excisionase family DNA binding protein
MKTDYATSLNRPPAAIGDASFLERLSWAGLEITNELGIGPTGCADVFFVAFLRMMSRFGVFSFGPVTIYVPVIEDVLRRTATTDIDPSTYVRFSNVMLEEQKRLGGPVNELHALLAFMRVNEGLAGRVFGELGVRPEQVEEYARSAGASGAVAPQKLYSPEEAAEYLGVHVQTVRAWIRSGRLKASRLAGQRALRIKAADLMTVLEPVDASDTSL